VIALSGRVCAGKTTLACALASAGHIQRVSTRKLLSRVSGVEHRRDLQQAGAKLDRASGGSWVAAGLRDTLLSTSARVHVIDAVRIQGQIDALRRSHRTAHVHLTAPLSTLAERYDARRTSRPDRELASFTEVSADPTEAHVEELGATADVWCDTGALTPAGTLEHVVATLVMADLPAAASDALLAALDLHQARP
jgi:adenylosuccinate synthase